MWFVGDDWAEEHHDVEVQDESGRRLGRARLPEGSEGVARLHALIAGAVGSDAEPDQVLVRAASKSLMSGSELGG